LARDLRKPEDGGLYVVASSPEAALLEWRPLEEMVVIDRSGALREVGFPTPGRNPWTYCWVGDRFLALDGRRASESPDEALEAHIHALELVGDTWQTIDLPRSGTHAADAKAIGCTADGIAFDTPREAVLAEGLPVLTANDGGDLIWRALPVSDLDIDDGHIVSPWLIGDVPSVALSRRGEPFEDLHAWDGKEWRTVAVDAIAGADALLGDFAGSLHLSEGTVVVETAA
jgi:hypothetical protein